MQSNLSTNLLPKTSSVEGRMYSILLYQLGSWCKQRDNVLHTPYQPCPDGPSGVCEFNTDDAEYGLKGELQTSENKTKKFERLIEYDTSLSFISIEGPPRFFFFSWLLESRLALTWTSSASTSQMQVLKQFYNKPTLKKVMTKTFPLKRSNPSKTLWLVLSK